MTAVVAILSAGEAQRLTQRIKLTASGVRDGLYKLRNLIDEAKGSNAWQVLGFASWTAYLVDTLGDEPMRVSREERLELVGYLAGEGLSVRAIAPIVGVGKSQVAKDVEVSTSGHLTQTGGSAHLPDEAVASPVEHPQAPRLATVDLSTGEIDPEPTAPTRTITGLDGKTYTPPVRIVKPVLAGGDLARFDAEKNARSVGEMLGVLEAITYPEHRARILAKWWPEGSDVVAPTKRDLFTPAHLRDFATALLAFADELEAQP